MDRQWSDHKNRIRIWGLLMLFLLLAGSVEAGPLADDWYWRSAAEMESSEGKADWKTFSITEPSFAPGMKQAWLMTRLPDESIPGAVLYMQTVGQSFEVWLDDRPLYQYGRPQEGQIPPGRRWHMIVLPPDYAGKDLMIHTYAAHPVYLGRFVSPRIDQTPDLMATMVRQDIPYAVNIVVALFMIVLLGIYFSSPVAPKWLYAAVITFMLELLLWMVCASNLKRFLLDAPVFWWQLMRALMYMMPLSANIILFLIVDKAYKRQTWLTVLVYIVLFLMAMGGELLGMNGLDACASAYYILLPILELMVFCWVARSALAGNGYCQAAVIPLVALALTGAIDGLVMHFHWLPGDSYWIPYATSTLGILLYFLIRQQIKRERYIMARAAGLEDEVARAIEKAEIDPLTQCYNRTKMDAVLQAEIRLHRQEPESFSLIMLDIDFFKRINDTFGHEAGDEVLAGFAAVIRQNIKKQDVFVRWGGEEFILICRGCTGKEAAMMAEKLRQKVEQSVFFAQEHITCSIGVASWQGMGDLSEWLLKRVDDALYEAKRTGRNRVCCEWDRTS